MVPGAAGGQSSLLCTCFRCMPGGLGLLSLKSNSVSCQTAQDDYELVLRLCDLSWECEPQARKSFSILHMSANDPQSPLSIDFGITNKFQRVGKFANIQSTNNKAQLYIVDQ